MSADRPRVCRRLCALAIVVGAAFPGVSAAQSPPQARGNEPPGQRWELEGYGGLSLGRLARGGKASLPAPGPPIATSSPVFPSWSVPSWFFGDGAAYLNNVAAEFGLPARVTPLDNLLQPLGLNDAAHVIAGVRLRRPLHSSWSIEFGVDISAQPVGLSDRLVNGLQETASTFQSTFTQILATGPFSSAIVNAGSTATAGSSRDVAITVALNLPMRSFGRFGTYAVAGGGIVVPAGDPTTAGLTGRYQFQITGAAPQPRFDESDTLTVRYRDRLTFVGVAGGGLRRAVSDRWGLRIDGRILIGPATTTVEVDAAPASVTGTPAGFIESFTYPNLQFSNNASTGRRSTLGPPALTGADVFKGGWLLRGRMTVGVYVTF